MDIFDRMLLDNKAWASEMVEHSPSYFKRLSTTQNPHVLWLGCSDSRVPAELVVNAEPGEMFVHRNIANQIQPDDRNASSVLEYAMEVLKVSHIVICGHYNCGGVIAAMSAPNAMLAQVNGWLEDVRETYRTASEALALLPDQESRIRRLVELNVHRQIQHLSQNPLVQRSWRLHHSPTLHGCVYGLEDGLIKVIDRVLPQG